MTHNETDQLAKDLKLPIFRVCSKDGRMINELFEFLAVRFFSKAPAKQESLPATKPEPIEASKGIKLTAAAEPTDVKKKRWFGGKCALL